MVAISWTLSMIKWDMMQVREQGMHIKTLCTSSVVYVCLLSCVLAAESRSVKAINCSWCSERWLQEDLYHSSPYFMLRVHYVQHSEGIHHSAMEDLSFWFFGKYLCVHVCGRVCAWIWVCTVCVCTAVTPAFVCVCVSLINGCDWGHFPRSSQTDVSKLISSFSSFLTAHSCQSWWRQ